MYRPTPSGHYPGVGLPGESRYTEDFQFLNFDAHRRPAAPLWPPVVTWQIGFRRPRDTPDEPWYQAIERLILSVLWNLPGKSSVGDKGVRVSNLHAAPIQFMMPAVELDELPLLRSTWQFIGGRFERTPGTYVSEKRFETVLIESGWRGLSFHMRFEVFEEYLTLFVDIDLGNRDAADQLNLLDEMPSVGACLHGLVSKINGRFEKNSRGRTTVGAVLDKDEKQAISVLYESLWDMFRRDCLDKAFKEYRTEAPPFAAAAEQLNPVHHDVFADFRGIALHAVCNEAAPAEGLCGAKGSCVCPPRDRKRCAQLRRRQKLCVDRNTLKLGAGGRVGLPISRATNKAPPELHHAWAKALQPVLEVADGKPAGVSVDAPSVFDAVDYTFSSLGSHRFIYGSGLGARFDSAERAGKPLTYIVLCFHDDPRQIGRTIARLQTLGLLRLSGLFELQKLMRHDQMLLRLEEELRDCEAAQRDSAQLLRRRTLKRLLERANKLAAYLFRCKSFLTGSHGGAGVGARKKLSCIVNGVYPVEEHGPASWSLDRVAIAFGLRLPHRWRVIGRLFPALHEHALVTKLREMLRRIKEYESKVVVAEGKVGHGPESWRHDAHGDLTIYAKDRHDSNTVSHAISGVIRLCDLWLGTRSRASYQETRLNQVRASLNSVNRRINEGVRYRAARSRVTRDLFEALIRSMRIDSISGYQRYDTSVKHRLERAYVLLQGIDLRFKSVSEREAELRARLARAGTLRHQATISSLQWQAEVAFYFVVAPYYVLGLAKQLGKHPEPPDAALCIWFGLVMLFVVIGVWRGFRHLWNEVVSRLTLLRRESGEEQ